MTSNSSRWYSHLFPGPTDLFGYQLSNKEYQHITTLENAELTENNEYTPILSSVKQSYNTPNTISVEGESPHSSSIDDKITSIYTNEKSTVNAGIFCSYFAIGVVSRLNQTPVQYYLIEHLHASSAQYSAYATLHRLPWSLKFIFGMLSDVIPIFGYRRKSWLFIGWLGYSIVSLILSFIGSPSINVTVFMTFAFTSCLVLADVCTDTLCVERSKLEPKSNRGSFQTIGFIYRAFGRIFGAILGTYLYDNNTAWSFNIAQIFFLQMITPIFTMIFFFWSLVELASSVSIPSFQQQFQEIWRVLQLEAVWKPMIFIYTFNIMQISNPVWSNFLVYGLGFNDEKLGYLLIFSAIISFIGYFGYRYHFFQTPLRSIYYFTSLLGLVFSLLQFILILRWNVAWGIPDLLFAIGDEATISLVEALNVMPFMIMFMMLCPEGSEGSTFALMTTISSLAGTVSNDIGTKMTKIWDVSNTTLTEGDFSGVLKLALLTTILKYIPLVYIGLLPNTRESYQKWIDRGETSVGGGSALATVIVFSFLYTLNVTLRVLL